MSRDRLPELEELAASLRGALARTRRRRLRPGSGERAAAVLVPFLELEERNRGRTGLLLERRARHLGNHAGQFAFPGGAVDAADPSVEAAALREAREETGLPPEHVEILGLLSDLRTPTGFVITPVVGVVRGRHPLSPSDDEVEELVVVPLAALLAAGAFTMVRRRERGVLIHSDALIYRGRVIWGATARILLAVRRLLRQASLRGTGDR